MLSNLQQQFQEIIITMEKYQISSMMHLLAWVNFIKESDFDDFSVFHSWIKPHQSRFKPQFCFKHRAHYQSSCLLMFCVHELIIDLRWKHWISCLHSFIDWLVEILCRVCKKNALQNLAELATWSIHDTGHTVLNIIPYTSHST